MRTLCLFLLTAPAIIAQTRTECFLDLPVFDPFGNRVRFEIVSVQAEDAGPNLLTTGDEGSRPVTEGDRLYYRKNSLQAPLLHIKLRAIDPQAVKTAIKLPRLRGDLIVNSRVVVSSCEQRTSLRVGVSDTNSDILASTIDGAISGCQTDEEWWVRAMPMFGGQNEPSVYEGLIHSNGTFSITANFRGERHIVVIGKANHALLAIGADVTSGGGKTNVGTLDLSKVCPQ